MAVAAKKAPLSVTYRLFGKPDFTPHALIGAFLAATRRVGAIHCVDRRLCRITAPRSFALLDEKIVPAVIT